MDWIRIMAQPWYMKYWKPFRHRVEYAFYRVLMVSIPHLPHACLVRLARWASFIAPMVVFWEARKARVNLDIAFGDSISRAEKKRIVRESFENVILTALYFFWSKNIDADNLEEFVEVPPASREVMKEVNRSENGTIVVLGHYGNWELMGVAMGYLDFPRNHIIVRQLKNPLLNDGVNAYRSKSGNRIVDRDRAMLPSLRALQRGEVVVIVCDQSIDPKLGGLFVPFFGLPAATTKAAAALSLRTGAPIMPATCEPLPGGRYRLRFDPLIRFSPREDREADIERLTAICSAHLEQTIRQRPGPWVWMYKRWRIRPTRERGRYPRYSKPAKDLRD